ncbi:MAG: C25 family cysteine peptidase [candidate division WOR-3 bacterium]
MSWYAKVLFLLIPGFLLAEIRIIRSDSVGVVIHYQPGKVSYLNRDDGRVTIYCDDAEYIAGIGEFDLPAKLVRIGIPQTGGVRLRFKTRAGVVLDDVEPARVIVTGIASSNSASSATLSTSFPVEIGSVEVLRSVRFVTLKFNPVQYDPKARRLSWYDDIEAELQFEHEPKLNLQPDPLDGVIKRMLLNGEKAVNWKITPSPTFRESPYQKAPVWLKIKIDSTGIYRITGIELLQAGVPLYGIDPKTLALWTLGEHEPNVKYPDSLRPVALLIKGAEDGNFDPGDTLIFYGLGADHWTNCCSTYFKNLYTRYNVYWLTWGGLRGERMKEGFGPDTTGTKIIQFARDVLHQEIDADCPARAGLLWIWATLFKPAATPATQFSCPLNLKYPSRLQRLTGRLYNESADNEISIRLNNRTIGSFQFGQTPYPTPYDFTIDTVIPLDSKENTFQIELRGQGDKKVYLDYIEAQYLRRLSLKNGQLHFFWDDTGVFRFTVIDCPSTPFILDVSDPYAPKACVDFEVFKDSIRFSYRISGRTEFAIAAAKDLRKPVALELKSPGRLWRQDIAADYFIIAPQEFIPVAQELARYRTGRIPGIPGARVLAVALEDLYNDFCFGLEEPWAVKHFLESKRPGYALLVGDATYDYKNNLNRTKTPGVPAYEAGFGLNPESGDRRTLAIDAWFADWEGEGSSPDLILGRVTVRSAYEFKMFVDKLIYYETGPAGYWTRRFLLLADDEFKKYPDDPDELRFRHIEQCEGMGALAGDLLDLVKVYLTEFPFEGPKSKPDANNELLRQLNLGALIWIFFGHGSSNALTHEEVLTVNRLNEISNGDRIPFSILASCSVGRFDDTRNECIGEELVRMSGGAVLSVAASTATPSGNNLIFVRNLLTPLFTLPESLKTIGSCFFAAWPTDRTYHLFGDPATVLRLPRVSNQHPLVKPETLTPGLTFTARSQIETERGLAEWHLFGPMRARLYRSPLGSSTNYLLHGFPVGRGNFQVKDGRFFCQGLFPLLRLDTLFVGNGYYVPIPRSCRFSAVVQNSLNNKENIAYLADSLLFDTLLANSSDQIPPEVSFYYSGRKLQDSSFVPSLFELEVVVEDPSGILIAPVSGFTPCLFVNDQRGKREIGDYFMFDDSSFTVARCRVQINLAGPLDSVFVAVADNFLNRGLKKITLQSVGNKGLEVNNLLVYPNPLRGSGFFTFNLNQPATVRIKIYTLSGRLVRDLGEMSANFGYNQIFWDGKDQAGKPLGNGVYLFIFIAENRLDMKNRQRVVLRDKFLVSR